MKKALHNQKSLSGDGTIKTVMIYPMQCKAEKQTHQTTDKHNGTTTQPIQPYKLYTYVASNLVM